MKKVKQVVTYICDECGKELDIESKYKPYIKMALDEDNIYAVVTIQRESHFYSYPNFCIDNKESILCDECKIKFLKMAIERLQQRHKEGET